MLSHDVLQREVLQSFIRGYAFNVLSYVVGSKSFRRDIQKPRHMENAVTDI